jgi:hypothetical protein
MNPVNERGDQHNQKGNRQYYSRKLLDVPAPQLRMD